MVFITGDTHGDFCRFTSANFGIQKSLSKDDFVMICGDFGGVWNDSAEQRYWLDWLDGKPWTTLFVDGNHENYDMLNELPISEWNGGRVHFVRPSVIHLMRGQVFSINGKTFFIMGGARSHDIDGGILDRDDPDIKAKMAYLRMNGKFYRINYVSWWKDEMPSSEEYDEALKNLDRVGWSVDYIITHCAPDSIEAMISLGGYEHDKLTHFLQELNDRCKFKHWYFGHYHKDLDVYPTFHLRYRTIEELKE